MLAPISTTNSIGRRGLKRSDIRPPAMRPSDSAPVIVPQAAGPAEVRARHHRAEHAERAVPGHQHHGELGHDDPAATVCERNSDQPSRSSRSMLGLVHALVRGHPQREHQRDGAEQPGAAHGQRPAGPFLPIAAMQKPASTAPPIWAPFMASRDSALASCNSSAGHEPRQQRRGRRIEHRHAGPGQALQRDHLPERRVAGQHQDPERALRRAAIITLAAMMTFCGAIRSAITPPTSKKISDGAICAAST